MSGQRSPQFQIENRFATHTELSSLVSLDHQINHGFAVQLIMIAVQLHVGVNAGTVVLGVFIVLIEVSHLENEAELIQFKRESSPSASLSTRHESHLKMRNRFWKTQFRESESTRTSPRVRIISHWKKPRKFPSTFQ